MKSSHARCHLWQIEQESVVLKAFDSWVLRRVEEDTTTNMQVTNRAAQNVLFCGLKFLALLPRHSKTERRFLTPLGGTSPHGQHETHGHWVQHPMRDGDTWNGYLDADVKSFSFAHNMPLRQERSASSINSCSCNSTAFTSSWRLEKVGAIRKLNIFSFSFGDNYKL